MLRGCHLLQVIYIVKLCFLLQSNYQCIIIFIVTFIIIIFVLRKSKCQRGEEKQKHVEFDEILKFVTKEPLFLEKLREFAKFDWVILEL